MDDQGDGRAGGRDHGHADPRDKHITGPVIALVPLTHIDAVWPHIAEGMKKACTRTGGDITPDWLFEVCRKGDALLFVAHEGQTVMAGLVCRVENWSGRRILKVLAGAGWGMERWLPALRDYREWLQRLGVNQVVFEGRKGWERVVPRARVVRQVYEVDINGRQD